MSTSRHRLKVSFTSEEMARVRGQTEQLRLSVSEFLRRLALGYHMPDPQDFTDARQILDILKVNGDLARLGNLLKLTLDVGDQDLPPATVTRINGLIAELQETQGLIKEGVLKLHFERHPRRAKT